MLNPDSSVTTIFNAEHPILTIDNGVMHIAKEFRNKQPEEIAKQVCDCLEKEWNRRHQR